MAGHLAHALLHVGLSLRLEAVVDGGHLDVDFWYELGHDFGNEILFVDGRNACWIGFWACLLVWFGLLLGWLVAEG